MNKKLTERGISELFDVTLEAISIEIMKLNLPFLFISLVSLMEM